MFSVWSRNELLCYVDTATSNDKPMWSCYKTINSSCFLRASGSWKWLLLKNF